MNKLHRTLKSYKYRILHFFGSVICYFKGHDIDYCIGCNPHHIRIGKSGIMMVCMRCGKVTAYDPGCD